MIKIPDPPFEGAADARIVCAAIQHKETKEIIVGPRHYDSTMRNQIEKFGGVQKWRANADQGFIDQFGRFIDRKVSWLIAESQGQIIQECSVPGTLYSENLY